MKKISINTAAPRPALTSVLMVYTGGTLGMVRDPDYGDLRPFDFEQILDNMPELSQLEYKLTVIAYEPPIDSSNMNPSIWAKLARTIEEYYENYDGFVILHGTDTMAFTASALSFLLEGLRKPVVLTGSQLPIGMIRTDARSNLINAIEIAGQGIVPEVCIFFDDVLLRGNRSKKNESVHFNAFDSENYPALAKAGTEIIYTPHLFWVDSETDFKAHQHLEENVAILRLFPGISEVLLQQVLSTPKLNGLVLETYGSGNAPTDKWFLRQLEAAIDKGITILTISQCVAGRVNLGGYETSKGLKEIGVLSGKDLTMEAAITKLMFVLAQGKTKAENKELLTTSLRGELTP